MNVVLWGSGVLSIPLLVVLYIGLTSVGTGVAIYALNRTGGLVGSTFGGGFAAAALVGAVAVATGLFVRHRWRRDDTKNVLRLLAQPSLALVLIFFLPAVFMTLLETLDVDVPDILSTAAIMGSIFYMWFVLPFAMGRGSWTLLRFLQRWGAEKKERAAQLIVALPILVLTGASVLFGPVIVGATDDGSSPDYALSAAKSSIVNADDSAGFVEQTRKEFASIATASHDESTNSSSDTLALSGAAPPTSGVDLTGTRQKRSDECFSMLLAPDADGESEIDRARRRALTKLKDESAAEDVVSEALANTCSKHAAKGIEGEIPRYFNVVVGNEIANYHRYRAGWRRFADAVDLGWIPPSKSDFFIKDAFENCMRELEPEEEALLRIYYVETDKDYDEVQQRFGISRTNARQKVSRARKTVRAVCRKYWN
jgi:DNA-directed RNA polymerase specialized sigma24 family protein